jgi:TRAP-type C4-dicarboxylate transport system permease small subunit
MQSMTSRIYSVPWGRLLHATLGTVAALLILAMMTLTSVDVIGRYIFNSPLRGGFELTELMLAALIFTALPLATERDEHIIVDLTDAFLPHGAVKSQVMVMSWLSAVVLAVLGWRLWHKAGDLVADGSVTNTLNIPLAPIGYLMAVSCLLTAVILVVQGVLIAFGLTQSNGGDTVAGDNQ